MADLSKTKITSEPFLLNAETSALLNAWMSERILPTHFLDDLPKIGALVRYENKPVCVCFLRYVEGGKGMIDGLLCDPKADLKVRSECIDQVVLDIIKLAHYNNMNAIFGLTLNKRVMNRARRLGFQSPSHKLVSLKISS